MERCCYSALRMGDLEMLKAVASTMVVAQCRGFGDFLFSHASLPSLCARIDIVVCRRLPSYLHTVERRGQRFSPLQMTAAITRMACALPGSALSKR